MKQRMPLWTPFVRGTPKFDSLGRAIFINSRYQVHISSLYDPPCNQFGRFAELSIKRRDKEPILDWRDMQKIKNDFFGPNSTMIQLFPPERHLVDTANQYYFYVFLDYEFPFGFKERLVSEVSGRTFPHTNAATKQRPFEPHQRPETLAEDELAAKSQYEHFLDNAPEDLRERLRRKAE